MPNTKVRKTPKHNKLWVARKRLGLGQKQLARLLNHQTADQVSRYERGGRVPTLRLALELEIALRTPLKVLFNELYDQLRQDIVARIKASPTLASHYSEALENESRLGECCTYAELLRQPHPAPAERMKVRDHVTDLAKKLAVL